jgi:hypothetical protein
MIRQLLIVLTAPVVLYWISKFLPITAKAFIVYVLLYVSSGLFWILAPSFPYYLVGFPGAHKIILKSGKYLPAAFQKSSAQIQKKFRQIGRVHSQFKKAFCESRSKWFYMAKNLSMK